MAASKKKKTASKARGTGSKTAGKASGRAGGSSTRRSAPAKSSSSAGGRDIFLLVMIVLSVVLLMSAMGFGGIIGNAISGVMFGVMGYMFYAAPAALLIFVWMVLSKKLFRRRGRKILSFIILFIAVCGLIQYMTEGVLPGNSLTDYYELSSLYRTGGGITGGAVCYTTATAFGSIGGLIVTVIIILVCVIEITQESFFGFLFTAADAVGSMIEGGRERYEEREPERELRREIRDTERQRMREERMAVRLQRLEDRKAALNEPADDYGYDPDFDDEDDYDPDYDDDYGYDPEYYDEDDYDPDYDDYDYDPEYDDDYDDDYDPEYDDDADYDGGYDENDTDYIEEGPVIGDRKTPARKKNPKVDSFPKEKRELNVPIFEDSYTESDSMKKARKAISKQKTGQNGGFLEGTWLKADQAEPAPEKRGRSHEMRELQSDFKIERGSTAAPSREIRTGVSVDEWDERSGDDEGWTLEDGLYALEKSNSRKEAGKKSAGAAPVKEPAKASVPPEDDTPAAEPAEPTEPVRRTTVKKAKSTEAEIAEGITSVENQINSTQPPKKEYVFPPLRLLKRGSGKTQGDSDAYLRATAQKLQDTLYNFGVNATVTNVSCGPTVTRFELTPEMGVKVSKIVGLADDIKLNLACADIRIEAPIPGKSAVGIEVPNKENSAVMLRDLLESEEFQKASSRLTFAVGKDIGGKPVMADIAKMPHVLIAGATGSGKSVCINTLIMSIIYKSDPEDVKLIMIDPKVVELSVYNGIPHLLIPVVTDPKKAAGALNWAVNEMTTRYNTFAEYSVRNLKEYNHKVENMRLAEGDERPPKMCQIVVIVDELADLMMVAPGDVEDAICRLAQLARAAGIHLVIATQRPSVNVITGLIKANMPSRIAFAVSSGVDSRTILDMNGAEKLLGKGDMLFYPQGYPKPVRLQGSFVSDDEVSAVVDFLKKKNPDQIYDPGIEQQMKSAQPGGSFGSSGDDRDAYFAEAGKFIIEKDKASIGMLQRMFKIGFNRAARVMDQLADAGVVGPEEGTKPRKILMTQEQFENYLEQNG